MRGRLILASLLVGSGVAAFGACSNAYVGVDDPVDAATSASDATAPTDALVLEDVDASDAADAADAADAVDPCDKDNDGYLAVACDGGDCDDTDPRAHPAADAGFVIGLISTVTGGDWNCDGVVTKQFSYNVTCAGALLGSDCTTLSGFSGDPACGAAGEFITCKKNGFECLVDATKTITKIQGCR